jgi:hypothetical protein
MAVFWDFVPFSLVENGRRLLPPSSGGFCTTSHKTVIFTLAAPRTWIWPTEIHSTARHWLLRYQDGPASVPARWNVADVGWCRLMPHAATMSFQAPEIIDCSCTGTSDGSYRFTLGNEFTESRSQEGIIHWVVPTGRRGAISHETRKFYAKMI